MQILVVTAVRAEHDAIVGALPPDRDVHVIVGGVGPAAAAAATSLVLASSDTSRTELVLAAGIGGAFAPLSLGSIAVATSIVFADLGAQTADGFRSVSELGIGTDRYDVEPKLAVELADRTGGHVGTVLTVTTVTGSASAADDLRGRFPDAVAEGMEGAGVAAAARAVGVAFGELRAISNMVGPRDRDAWRIPEALTALGRAVSAATA